MKKKECPSCAMDVDESSLQCPVCGYEFTETSRGWVKWLALIIAYNFAPLDFLKGFFKAAS